MAHICNSSTWKVEAGPSTSSWSAQDLRKIKAPSTDHTFCFSGQRFFLFLHYFRGVPPSQLAPNCPECFNPKQNMFPSRWVKRAFSMPVHLSTVVQCCHLQHLLHGCSVFPAIGQPFLLVLRMGHVQARLPAQKEAGLEFSCFWLEKRVDVKWPMGTTGPERVSGGMAAELCCIELALFCFG